MHSFFEKEKKNMRELISEISDQFDLKNTSLANLGTHQAQWHSQSLVTCFVRMYTLAPVRTYGRTAPSKLMTTYERWAWWVNNVVEFQNKMIMILANLMTHQTLCSIVACFCFNVLVVVRTDGRTTRHQVWK